MLGGPSRPRLWVMAEIPHSPWGALSTVCSLSPQNFSCVPVGGQECHHPAMPIPRSPGSSVERQPKVPEHLTRTPRHSCHLPPEQKEVTEHPHPQSRPGHPQHCPALTTHSLPRARRLLFPPLPKPVGTKAIQFSAGEMGQVRCKVQEGADPTAPNAHAQPWQHGMFHPKPTQPLGPAPDRPPGALGEVQPRRAAADGAESQRGDD